MMTRRAGAIAAVGVACGLWGAPLGGAEPATAGGAVALAKAGAAPVAAQENGGGKPAQASDARKLVYADFENSTDGRPSSSRGGQVRLFGWQENPTILSVFKGHEADNSIPKLVRTSKNDQNHAAAFEYELHTPNQWAGVTMEVNGHPGEPGALPADDMSGYKYMNIAVYATGTQYVRVEIKSNGKDINLHSGYPVTGFKLKEGFNTYQMRLSSFSQPAWVTETRIDPKEVLKQLTSIAVSVYCDDCRPTSGLVIVDNLAFEK